MTPRESVRRHQLTAFFLLAYGVSWTFWLTARVVFPPDLPVTQRAPAQLLGVAGTFGPFVAAVAVAWATGTGGALRTRLLRWRVAPRWYAVALCLPVVAVATAYGGYRMLGGAPLDPSRALPVTSVPALFVVTLLAGGGNEEPGWRGFALPRLQERFGPLLGTLVLAALWAGWHLPAFFDPSSTQAALPPVAWTLGVVVNSLVLTYLFNATVESVPVAALYHATFNVAGLWVLSGLPVDDVGVVYWMGIGLFTAVAAGLVLVTRGGLGVSRNSPAATDGG